MKIINRLLRKNLSAAQIAGFILSNFIGMAIVIAGVQFYEDMRSIWESEDSFITTDYIVVNKRVTSANTLGTDDSAFTDEEIADLNRQPWVRKCAGFTSLDYRVSASVSGGNRSMSTDMFFESIPTEFLDVKGVDWSYSPAATEVPVIISKDYLTLYNFGFATSAGMPQVSEQMMSAIPLRLRLYPAAGGAPVEMMGRVVGFSNRLNTILVPQEFLEWSNARLGSGQTQPPRRLIVDVSSPGDVAIDRYMADHNMEIAGDKTGSQASYLLNVVSGVIVGIGIVITLLSFFILLLSISLLMQKNRDKLHALLMLGFDLKAVETPYCRLIAAATGGALLLAIASMLSLRAFYASRLVGLSGAESAGIWQSLTCGVVLALLTIIFNIVSVKRKVKAAWRL